MAQSQGWVRRYAKAFCKGFFVAVPVAVTFLDRVACVARVEGASMQPSLNPGGSQSSDVVLLNHWKVRNFEVQRGDIVSLVRERPPVGRLPYRSPDWTTFEMDEYTNSSYLKRGHNQQGKELETCRSKLKTCFEMLSHPMQA
ncbi:mitochondrial inner membrane protease subunit 2 isoform X2 [Ursus maritimus]|uniref:Mitochondrial inner membrane protease subunit 2 isoform X2 n=2 Tax=Ursus maritimus TaxID=29073 RepID=A0A8M1GWB4_URSMA|nr:mitochondrial inner membrane protease subunit 2 isoform X2 [Ursus maritimus]